MMSDLKAAYNIVANALERDNTPARSEISKLLQEAVGDALDEIETLRARVAELEAEGEQPVKVPESKGYEDAPTTLHTYIDEAWADGWNACREAMLAAQED